MADSTSSGDTNSPGGVPASPDDQLGAVLAAAGVLGQEPNLDTVLPSIAELLTKASGADRCAFFVYDEELTHTIASYRFGGRPCSRLAQLRIDSLSPWDVPIEAEVLRQRRPIQRTCETDFARWPMANAGHQVVEGRKCDLTVPLLWDDHPIGVAALWRLNDPTPFDAEQIRLIQSLAHLAAIAIGVARLYEAERTHRDQLRTLVEVSRRVNGLLRLNEILRDLAHAIRTATRSDATVTLVRDADGQWTSFVHEGVSDDERSMVEELRRFTVSDILPEQHARDTLRVEALRQRAPTLPPNSPFAHWATKHNVSALLTVPLAYRGNVMGLVCAWRRSQEAAFGTDAIRIAEAIAQQAAGVIASAQLYAATEQYLAELEALYRISQAVTTCHTLDSALDVITTALRHAIPADKAFVALMSDETSALRVVRAWGENPPNLVGYELPLDRGLTGYAVRTGTILNIPDVTQDPRTYYVADPNARSVPRAVLLGPLVVEGRKIGAIHLSRVRSSQFSPQQERLFGVLIQQASLVIDRIMARQEIARREREQTFLAEAGDLLLSTADPLSVLPKIAQNGVGILGDGILIGGQLSPVGGIEWTTAASADGCQEAGTMTVREEDFESLTPHLSILLDIPRPAVISVCQERHTWPIIAGHLERVGLGALLVTPLRQEDRTFGLLAVAITTPERPFDAKAIELAESLAYRISEALDRRQRAMSQAALLRISNLITKQYSLQAILETIAEELMKIIPYDECLLLEADHDSQMLRARLFHDAHGAVPGRGLPTIPFGEGICGTVVCSRQTEMLSAAHADPRASFVSPERAAFWRATGQSALVAPLIAEDTVLGALFLARKGVDQFLPAEFDVFQLFAAHVAGAMYRAMLTERNNILYRASVETLAAAVDAKDPYTLEHSRNVAHYARIGAEGMGLPQADIEQIELAGLLHDIGKIGIPDRILTKPGKLDPDERRLMMGHAARGAEILAEHPALAPLVPLVRHHHEWYDGHGYPDGLVAAQIPLGAAIIGVADAFDTMTSDRAYQRRRTVPEALQELERYAGTQFHPDVAARFTDLLRVHPEHSRAQPWGNWGQCKALEHLQEEIGGLAESDALLDRVPTILTAHLTATDLAIYLRDATLDELVLVASATHREAIGKCRLPAGVGVSSRALATKRVLNLSDAQLVAEFLDPFQADIRSELIVPILAEDESVGVICANRAEPIPFTAHDEELLVAVATHLAPILRHVQAEKQ